MSLLMAHLTLDQLHHLCNLVALRCTPVQQEQLLPQLEHIITMVSQLQDISLESDHELSGEGQWILADIHATFPEADFAEQFFKNIQHPLKEQAIQLKTRLTRE